MNQWPVTESHDWCGEFEMREDVKPCVECGQPSGEDGITKMEHNAIIGRFCKACSEKVSVASKNKTARCVECMEPIGGSHYVPFIVNEETRYIHQLCAERRLMMGRKIYP